jgi:SNF2 family DNA or RNA helicase
MGLGKTLSAIAAVHAADAFPALVICPALLKVNWQREVAHWFPGTTTEVLYGRKPRRVPPVEFVIANYDIVAAWEEHLIAGGFQSIVLDESHNIRNTNARSLSVRRVARKVPETGLRLALSGTPVWLQARDLWHQLDALGRQDQMGGWPFFNRRYVKSKHPEELHERLRATCYVRRVKADVMSELPAKTRAPQWLQPADLTEYRKAEADLIAYVQERAARIAAELGENPKSAAVRAKFKAQAAPDLVRIAALKRLAAEAKIGDAAKWIGDFLETGKKLVVFAHHRSVLDTLAAKLGADVVVGGQGDKARQAAVDRFQSDPSAKVLVCALTAAGVGITLTAASDVLFLELGWTAAGHDQCEDRCHRIGQHDNVTAWYMLADGTIDADNWNLLAERRAEMEAVTDGQVSQTRDTHMGVSLLMRMAGIGDDDVPGVDDDLFLLDDEGEAA